MESRILSFAEQNGLFGRCVKLCGDYFVLGGLLILLNFASGAAQIHSPTEARNIPTLDAATYENQQRARRLLQMDTEITTLPDVEIRCQLRFNILEFVYTKEARTEYPAAEPLLIAFFEEMAAHEKQLATRTTYWRNSMALILRKYAPETAKMIEAKYVNEVDTSGADYEELRKPGADQKAIVGRAIERVRTGKNIWGIINIFETVKRTDKDAAEQIVVAVLDYAEKRPEPEATVLLHQLIVSPLNPPTLVFSDGNMLRYYQCLVAGADVQLSKAKPDAYLYLLSPLRRALPKLKELDKRLYADAQAAIARYRTSLSKEALAKDEALERIEVSDDGLEQTIAEAESATDQQAKDYFWGWAASRAAQKGEYRQAVELMMKASHNLGMPTRPNGRDEDLLARVARPAIRKRDYDAATYAIDRIQDKLVRAEAMLELGDELGRFAKDRVQAVAIVTNALDLMEMTAPGPWSICLVGNSRYLLMNSGHSPIGLQELTARAVMMVNRIPTQGADAKAGTPERAEFMLKTLSRALGCVGYIFRPVMPGGLAPNPDLASRIKIKEWRLAAEIEAEKARRYPPPASLPL